MSVSNVIDNADSCAHFAWDASKPPPAGSPLFLLFGFMTVAYMVKASLNLSLS